MMMMMVMIYGRVFVSSNSAGHDAHGWKLTDEDGEKRKNALCCASAAPSASLPYQDWGLEPNNEII